MTTVLVVDDEIKIRQVVASCLEKDGYRTIEAKSGNEAIEAIKQNSVDAVILDLMLPDMSGEDVCVRMRKLTSVPILMLTAKVSEEDRVNGLSLGADDYVLKPFSIRELVARVRALLRRSQDHHLLADRMEFGDGDLVINTLQHEVYVRSEIINLTPNEYKLLLTLARYPERTFTREDLIEKILGIDFEGDIRTIDQHVKNLRQKIESDPKHPQFIATVFGVGYRFVGDRHV